MSDPDLQAATSSTGSGEANRARPRVDAVREWAAPLAIFTCAVLLFESVTGLTIFLLGFSTFNQFAVLLHTGIGLVTLLPVGWYVGVHWWKRRGGNLSHLQLLGYAAALSLAVASLSGIVLTAQGIWGTRISRLWDEIHLVSSLAFMLLLPLHLLTLVFRQVNNPVTRNALRRSQTRFTVGTVAGGGGLVGLCLLGGWLFQPGGWDNAFPPSYDFPYGEDKPFAPSLARTDTNGALDARSLAGSRGCGTSGCHSEILAEWLPSAHRYSSVDFVFQEVQANMAREVSPQSTRYCAGCHDPIALFSGAKDEDNISLSVHGADEGISCVVCHSIVQADVRGNADYTLTQVERYLFEDQAGAVSGLLNKFLIRTYPRHHVSSYSRPLYKTAEFCGACHKQFLDEQLNNTGFVQGQNQYDSWRKSRWHDESDDTNTIGCRECHMPLVRSDDPATGDDSDRNRSPGDGRHRSHRTLAANQFVPRYLGLEGAEEHCELTVQWLRGEYEVPEIADRWTKGPVVRLELIAPETIRQGEEVTIQTLLTNNKAGHDFPTGPMDMIEGWVELTVTDAQGNIVFESARPDERGYLKDPRIVFMAELINRDGELIGKHDLWNTVGARFKRALFPGFMDTTTFTFACPSMPAEPDQKGRLKPRQEHQVAIPDSVSPGDLKVSAVVWYCKFSAPFLDRLFGEEAGLRSEVTDITRAETTIRVLPHEQASAE